MSKLPVDSYLDFIRRSGLVETDTLAEKLKTIEAANPAALTDCDLLGKALAESKLITSWHHKMLIKGLWRGFFLGRYKLLRELGAGGMSSVYLAEHSMLRRRVAIKVLSQKRAANQSHLTRFYRESRSTAALDHPNVVRVFDFDTDGKFHYLVMEYVDGPTMQDLVDQRGPLGYQVAGHYAMQACLGLAYAHEKGLIHRDVKPANLLISSEGIVKVSDLGLARIQNVQGPSITMDDGSVLGTVDYLAPEQALDSHNIDARADIYSLGCTIYFMLTGQQPFPTGTMAVRLVKHQTEPAQPIKQFRPDVPSQLTDLVEQMMAKRPNERPLSHEAAGRLQQWLGVNVPKVEIPRINESGIFPPLNDQASKDTITGLQPSTIMQSMPMETTSNSASETPPPTPLPIPAPTVPTGGLRKPPSAPSEKISVNCQHCGTMLNAPISAAGRKAKCPQCSGVVLVPAAPTPASATDVFGPTRRA